MAIMGIPQALKMIEGPIDALARLPQQSLVAMAQRSPSVLKVLPIVLNEKADAAQRAANMAALAQGTPPSVTEQNMAINAQAEAQPMMAAAQPMTLPENVGVAALPVPEGGYAGGGIVAFDAGGQAKSDSGSDQIEQLYTTNLMRASDPEGYRFWSEKFGPEVDAAERALFIAEAAPEVQRRIAAGDTNLPEYMRVDPAVRRALQSKDVTTEDFKTLSNYFGNQFIGGEAEDPASLTRRDYIERPRTGYDFATFLASRSQQHGAQPDTKQRLANLMAPFMNVDTSEAPAEMRYTSGEGNEFGYVVTNPLTGEREMAYPSGALGPTQEGRYRTSYGVHHSSIGDPDRTRYAVGLDYLVDPKTGRARLVDPYLEGYQERRRNNSLPIKALATIIGASAFPGMNLGNMINRGLISLGGEAASRMAKGGEVPRYQNQGLVDLVRAQQGGDPYSQYSFVQTRPQTYEDFLQMTTAARAAVPPSPEAAAIRKYLEDTNRKASDVRTDAYLRAIEAGLGIMAGTSPYALTNIGQGSQAAVKGFAEDVKERRKQSLADMQLKLQLDQAERNEKLAAITAAESAFGRQQDITSREEIARRDIASREDTGKLDRENRMAIAMIPDKAMQVAAQLRKDNPSMSYLESITQASQALTPRDTYNATRNAVSAAAKDANAEFTTRAAFDSKLQEDIKKAAAGDQAAAKRIQDIRNKIQQDVFRLYQVQGVDLSSGRMGASGANDPLGIR